MPRTALLIGSVTDGSLSLTRAEVRAALQGWPDGRVEVSIRPQARDKSLRQLRYYWGRVLPLMADETGQDVESIHADMCERFLPRRRVAYVHRGTGEVIEREIVGRVSGSKAPEMFDFTERVRQFAAEFLGLVIPPPEDAGTGVTA